MFSTNTVRCPDYAVNERQDIIHSAAFQGAVMVINTLAGSSAVQTKQEMLFTLDIFSFWGKHLRERGGGGGGAEDDKYIISRKLSSTNQARNVIYSRFLFLWWVRMMNALAGSSAVQSKQEMLFTLDFFFFGGGGGGTLGVGGYEGDQCISRKFSSTNKVGNVIYTGFLFFGGSRGE